MSDHLSQPVVQVHGQRYPRDVVEIFGSTSGLERLINALIDAVQVGQGESRVVAGDGHWAAVRASRLDGTRRAADWRRSGSPYLDVDDPLVVRIIELTAENVQLRRLVRRLHQPHAEPPRQAEPGGGGPRPESTDAPAR